MISLFKVICLVSLTGSSVALSAPNIVAKPQYSLTAAEYAEVNYQDDIKGGAKIICTQIEDPENDFAEVTINLPETINISGADALTIRIKAISGSYPFFLNVFDENNNSVQLPSNNSSKYVRYYAPGATRATLVGSGGNDHSRQYGTNADGTLILPLDALEPLSGTINYTKVKKLTISVAVKYDYNFACAFGDLGIVTTDKQWKMKFDCSEHEFAQVYSVTAFPDYITVSKMRNSGKANWMGDVKLLNELSYDSTDELHSNVTWNPGDNLCTYTQENDAMRVHIGPYEVEGHRYGSYMALKLSNTDGLNDYDFSKTENEVTSWGKGLTMYLKNCSKREIGINLQFDEYAGNIEGQDRYERWLMKGYPAMYYAWDINTDAEYLMYSKSDQFQIPIGFEGYVRIPFDQLLVPEWNKDSPGVDQILDITKFNKEFYLTSDNTRYEDLEFLIKNVGVYFNETYKATLFDNSHGIKANMGL